MPRISLIVLAYNNWRLTAQCLNTLARSIPVSWGRDGVEVIVVDNGSDAEAQMELRKFAAQWTEVHIALRTLFLAENLGYPSGINAGLAACEGELIGVLNNDLVFPPGWLEPLVEAVETDKLVAFAAPFLSFAASIQNVQRQFATYDEMVRFAADFTSTHHAEYQYVDKVIGACMVMRRDVLTTIGGNDFWFGIGNYDDDDWCLRARLAGYKIVLVGGSFVEHVGHATFKLDTAQFSHSLGVNALKFELKWDIRESANAGGSYSRMGVLKTARFNREKHFVPVHLSDYSTSRKPFYPPSGSTPRVLLCADWTSPQSDWRSALARLVVSAHACEICLWIPRSHFQVNEITSEVQRVVGEILNGRTLYAAFTVFQDDVPYVDIPRILRSADAVVQVEADFVNRYVTHLAKEIECEVFRG